jgi:crossover junction endodeoxyribonuclease RuvC
MHRDRAVKVIGIDPGLSGALWYDSGHYVYSWLDMPTIEVNGKRNIDGHAIRDWIVEIGHVDHVILEHVQGVQGSGATGAFTFGFGAGLIEGLLIALDRPYTKVRPQRWTKDLGIQRDKGAHRLAAQALHPHHAQVFARVKDDGRADAALLCHWWNRTTAKAA